MKPRPSIFILRIQIISSSPSGHQELLLHKEGIPVRNPLNQYSIHLAADQYERKAMGVLASVPAGNQHLCVSVHRYEESRSGANANPNLFQVKIAPMKSFVSALIPDPHLGHLTWIAIDRWLSGTALWSHECFLTE